MGRAGIDYFETDKSVNAKQIGIEGLPRYGKQPVAMATNPAGHRLLVLQVQAALKIRGFWRTVENSFIRRYHWFAGNFTICRSADGKRFARCP
jgi:hypothetical protein